MNVGHTAYQNDAPPASMNVLAMLGHAERTSRIECSAHGASTWKSEVGCGATVRSLGVVALCCCVLLYAPPHRVQHDARYRTQVDAVQQRVRAGLGTATTSTLDISWVTAA